MPKTTLTPYKRHKAKWSSCQLCPLGATRWNICLARGQVPADILFIGEAPGPGENVLGRPFVGPAGKLLDGIIQLAYKRRFGRDWNGTPSFRLAFTNLIACFPKNAEGGKFTEPPKDSIKACAPRLLEFFNLCKPQLVINLGDHAKKWTKKILPEGIQYVDMVHPGSILRVEKVKKPVDIQNCSVVLADAMWDVNPSS